MTHSDVDRVWAVVLVESGIPTEIKIFRDISSAMEFEISLRGKVNLEDDEIGMFDLEIHDA